MARITRDNRSRKFPPQYRRSMLMEGMPHGGCGTGGVGVRNRQHLPDGWPVPAPRRLVNVVMASGIKPRWATIVQ